MDMDFSPSSMQPIRALALGVACVAFLSWQRNVCNVHYFVSCSTKKSELEGVITLFMPCVALFVCIEFASCVLHGE